MSDPAAFPSQLREASAPGDHNPEAGMTLRDYFAAQAFGHVIGSGNNLGQLDAEERASIFGQCAALIYDAADAMLVERAKRSVVPA
jgi:hypothetical protein